MVKALLSRVGADKGNLGCLGPLFKDYSFEYIPINEKIGAYTLEDRTFRELDARFSDNKLSHFIKNKKLKDAKPHYDPEFETFTYGDPTTDREKFLELEKGDILLFYAGLDPWKFKRKKGEGSCYIIGYFTVKDIADFEKSEGDVFEKYPQLLNNAHIKRVTYVNQANSEEFYIPEVEPGLVVVIGDDKKSKLLEKAIPFSEPKKDRRGNEIAYVSKKMEKELGIKGYVQRKKMAKSAEVIQGDGYIKNLKMVLDY